MIFHSLDFVAFFIVTTVVYWRLPHRAQNVLLLGASYFFYGYVHPWFLTLIFASTVADYWAARGMEAQPERKRLYLVLSLVVNLGMLGFFKYFNFFAENVHALLAVLHLDVPMPALRVILPVGISFYTFQEPEYTLEVYRGTLKARARFSRLRDLRLFLPAAGRRPDRTGAASVAAGGAAPRVFVDARARGRPAADRLGLLQEAGHRRQRRRHRQQGVLARRRRASTCSGPASSRSQFRSTPTSPPTATSRVARPGGWASTSCATSTTRISPPAGGVLAALAHLAVELVP